MTYKHRPVKPVTQKDVDRFWSKVDIGEPDECWNWLGKPSERLKHGLFNAGNTLYRPARFAYQHHKGLNAVTLQRKHKIVVTCGNPLCCNPAHMVAETQQAVWNRIVNSGTMKIGSKHKRSKLTEADIVNIRQRYTPNSFTDGLQHIGDDYGVTPGCIRDIVIRKTWRHVE